MNEQETHFCGDPSECHYDEGYEKALKECKKMFEDYNEKLQKELGHKSINKRRTNKQIIEQLSKEVLGE